MTDASLLFCSLRCQVGMCTHKYTHIQITTSYHAITPAAVFCRSLIWHQRFKNNDHHCRYVLNQESQYDSNICLKATENRTCGNIFLVFCRNKLSALYVEHMFAGRLFHCVYVRFGLGTSEPWRISITV